jgi:hypothetical protein
MFPRIHKPERFVGFDQRGGLSPLLRPAIIAGVMLQMLLGTRPARAAVGPLCHRERDSRSDRI